MAILFLEKDPNEWIKEMQDEVLKLIEVEHEEIVSNIKVIQFKSNEFGAREAVIAKPYNGSFIFLNNLILYRK